jgi:hypothetical protein
MQATAVSCNVASAINEAGSPECTLCVQICRLTRCDYLASDSLAFNWSYLVSIVRAAAGAGGRWQPMGSGHGQRMGRGSRAAQDPITVTRLTKVAAVHCGAREKPGHTI